jgi:hypothetical protein
VKIVFAALLSIMVFWALPIQGAPSSITTKLSLFPRLQNGALIVINETEYTWYGDLIINETDTVVIENCSFKLADGSITVLGELHVFNSTINIQKSTLYKSILVDGGILNISLSTITGTGILNLQNANFTLISNTKLKSWRIGGKGPEPVYISDSELQSIDCSTAPLSIHNSTIFYQVVLRITSSGYNHNLSDLNINRLIIQTYVSGTEFRNLRNNVENWTLTNEYGNIALTNSTINEWTIALFCASLSIVDSDANIIVGVKLSGTVDDPLTFRAGTYEYERFNIENNFDLVISNSTIHGWLIQVYNGNFHFSNSDFYILVLLYSPVVTVVNSTAEYLGIWWTFSGSLVVKDSVVGTVSLKYYEGTMDFVLSPGYQERIEFSNGVYGSNVTLLRTTVNYWGLEAWGTAVFNIYNSTLPGPCFLFGLTMIYPAGVIADELSQVYIYDSNLTLGMAKLSSSFQLDNSTIQQLYAYEDSSITAINSTIGTIVKDPPTINLVDSDLSADISLSFSIPSEMLLINTLDDYGTPLPPNTARASKYLQVNSTYDDLINAQIRIFYNETETDETGVQMYHLDERNDWQLCPLQGVNITENFVWANVTRFSCFVLGVGDRHNIAIISFLSSKCIVGQGFCTNVSLAIRNDGTFDEIFNVTLYANAAVIASFGQVALSHGISTLTSFSWNTSGFSYHDYTLSAFAEPVTGETYTLDNNVTAGVVYVGVPGDVDGNHIVNMLDLYKIALRFGAARYQPYYVPEYDIEDNGIINMLDLYIAATHFGQTDP